MSTWVPPPSIPALNDGDPLPAKPLKDLVASLQAFLNGEIGDPNINVDLDPTERIAWAKIDSDGQIDGGDIGPGGIPFSSFSSLKVSAQGTPNNTVLVAAGTFLSSDGLSTQVYAGGSSGAFSNTSGAGMRRIDLLSITDAGALVITPGVEGAAPIAPDYPSSMIPLAEIYIRFSGTGVVILNTDNTVDSYILRDVRPLIKPSGVPDDSITGDKLAPAAAGFVNRVEGATDVADPGTSYVTLTGMTYVAFYSGIGSGIVGGCLLTFDGAFEFTADTPVGTNFPMLEVRLMVGPTGSAVEVHKAVLDLRLLKKTTDIVGPFVFPLSLAYQCVFNSGGNKDARIEWRRTSGASGTSSVRQVGTVGKRVFSMTTIQKAGVTP